MDVEDVVDGVVEVVDPLGLELGGLSGQGSIVQVDAQVEALGVLRIGCKKMKDSNTITRFSTTVLKEFYVFLFNLIFYCKDSLISAEG